LRELADRGGFGTVDPAPEVTDAIHTVFVPARPEQVDRVRPTDTGAPPS
jgi:hypothetical protein